jgi:hypothetical protein
LAHTEQTRAISSTLQKVKNITSHEAPKPNRGMSMTQPPGATDA